MKKIIKKYTAIFSLLSFCLMFPIQYAHSDNGGMDHPRCTVPNTSYTGNRDEYLFHISVYEEYFLLTSRWEKENEKYMIKIPGISDSIKSGRRFSDKEFINFSKKILNWGINNKNGECRFYIKWNFNNSGKFLSTDRVISAPDIISRYYYQWKQSIGSKDD